MRALAASLLVLSPPFVADATTFLIEAENLESTGGWLVSREKAVARDILWSGAKPQPPPAVGAIELPKAGKWRLWVRSKDYPEDRPGIRNFTVRLGSKRSATVFGKHGRPGMEGWEWEDGGTFDLAAGPTLIVVGDESTAFARCDALVLTDVPTYQPKGVPWGLRIPEAKAVALAVRMPDAARAILPPPLRQVVAEPAARLQNGWVRLSFHKAATSGGEVVAQRAAIRTAGGWKPMTGDSNAESYRVLFRPKDSDPRITASRVHPTWDTSFSPEIEVGAGGAFVKSRIGPPTAPWASAHCLPVRPAAVRQVGATAVELDFPPLPPGRLKATWRLATRQPQAQVTLSFVPNTAGWFSIGYHGLVAAAPADTDVLLLPFMFHGKRFPARPVTLLNALTPTPMALVNRDQTSYALTAEPGELPFEWPGAANSRYAFGLRNETGQAQPFLYTPVLGQPGSLAEAATPVRGRFRVWLQPADWYAAYRRVVDEVFDLTDYRRPTSASLSDAALNLYDLMRDEKASGWDARAKGPWNIESRNTVTHASPLTYLSYYLLTGDEEFYRRFTLPTLEFMLSRPSAHFAAEREIGKSYYQHQPMRGPVPLYGATVFGGAWAMTHGRTPAFADFCLDDKGQPRKTGGYSHVQWFEDALALYRLTGAPRLLEGATQGADRYIAENLARLPDKDLGVMPFLNISFVPDWEGLLHLHEATGKRRFLEAATGTARWLLTTLWVQPPVPQGEITIHPGGVYEHAKHIWWYGDKRFRRGLVEAGRQTSDETAQFDLPPTRLPEKQVPAWQVSNVGLGLEQPCTYTRTGRHANITMSCWAPNLLRLARFSEDPLFRTAARNATIGRFANYPGYYMDGMTDRYQRPDYPLAGPDVTTIYHHHIPPFAAYVLDYLFTDAEMRSKGAVSFPWVRQCGYAWFDNRLRGHAPGSVYGQRAWPWLHRTAATVDTVNVDRVLAHGDGRFHVVLLNQVRERQPVLVAFDPAALGRPVEGAAVRVWRDSRPAPSLKVRDGAVALELAPLGLAALRLDGARVDVPTHRAAPPAKVRWPETPGLRRVPIPGTKLEAVGAEILVPPFTWRDLYVYITAGIEDCRGVTMRYRAGDGPERQMNGERFPWEFSARVGDMESPITWSVEVRLNDGRSILAR